MTDNENNTLPGDADSAPLDRTDAVATKADLFDTARWLEQRLGEVRNTLGEMTGDSGEITQQILGDLAGIRAEQIHLARRLDELRGEIRAELRRTRVAAEPDLRPVFRRRRIMPGLVFMAPILLLLLLAVLVLLIPTEMRALLHNLWAEGPVWLQALP